MSKEKVAYDIISGIYLLVVIFLFASFVFGLLQLGQTFKSDVDSSVKQEANKSFQNNALFSIKYSLIFGGIYSILLIFLVFRFSKTGWEKVIGVIIALVNLKMFAIGPIYYFSYLRKEIV